MARYLFIMFSVLLAAVPARVSGQEVVVPSILPTAAPTLTPDTDMDKALPEPTYKDPFLPKIPLVILSPDRDDIPVFEDMDTEIGFEPAEEIIPPPFDIAGVVWDSKRPQAIINSTVVNIGDVVDSWVVADITAEGVTMTFQNQSVVVEPKGVTYGAFSVQDL